MNKYNDNDGVCDGNDNSNFTDGIWQGHNQATMLPSWFVIQLTATASLGGCLFGYDMGAISGILPQLTNTFDLDDRQKELCELIRMTATIFGVILLTALYDAK